MVKGPEAPARMVKDPIQDDADVAGVGGIQQGPQRRVATQQRVDHHIIIGVIPMVGRRRKDRVKIERGNAQGLQIIELFNNAIQVAALIALLFRRRAPRFQGNAIGMARLRAAGKAIRKNLVENGLFHPIRCLYSASCAHCLSVPCFCGSCPVRRRIFSRVSRQEILLSPIFWRSRSSDTPLRKSRTAQVQRKVSKPTWV